METAVRGCQTQEQVGGLATNALLTRCDADRSPKATGRACDITITNEEKERSDRGRAAQPSASNEVKVESKPASNNNPPAEGFHKFCMGEYDPPYRHQEQQSGAPSVQPLLPHSKQIASLHPAATNGGLAARTASSLELSLPLP